MTTEPFGRVDIGLAGIHTFFRAKVPDDRRTRELNSGLNFSD